MLTRLRGRSRWWRLFPLAVAAACFVLSLFVPTHVGNWLVVAGIALAVVCLGPGLRANGGARFFLGRR